MALDILGQTIEVGSRIITTRPYYRNLVRGVITKIMPKKVALTYIDENVYGKHESTTVKYHQEVVVYLAPALVCTTQDQPHAQTRADAS